MCTFFYKIGNEKKSRCSPIKNIERGTQKYLASQKLLQTLDFPRPERAHHRSQGLGFQNLLKSLVLLHWYNQPRFLITHTVISYVLWNWNLGIISGMSY